jgi:hypothetical protein
MRASEKRKRKEKKQTVSTRESRVTKKWEKVRGSTRSLIDNNVKPEMDDDG